MDAQGAVRVAFGVVFLGELAFRKGLWGVLALLTKSPNGPRGML